MPGLAKRCIDWRSTQIIMGTKQKLCANYEDLHHFAFIPFHYVACLHECWQFLESFLVAQYSPLVRFDLACRSDGRHSDNWPALDHALLIITSTSLCTASDGSQDGDGMLSAASWLELSRARTGRPPSPLVELQVKG